MSNVFTHQITVCLTCGRGDAPPGEAVMARLRGAVGAELGAAFQLRGVACMAGCDRPCAVAFQADGKATYLFGDIDAGSDADIAALAGFARQYRDLADGWCSATERPRPLYRKTLARVPAAFVGVRSASAEDGPC